MPEGRRLKALIPGGISAKILTAGEAGVRMDFDALLAAGHRTVVLDDLSTGFREAVPPAAAFVQGDCADADAMAARTAEIEARRAARMAPPPAEINDVADAAGGGRPVVAGWSREWIDRYGIHFEEATKAHKYAPGGPIDNFNADLLTMVLDDDGTAGLGLRHAGKR